MTKYIAKSKADIELYVLMIKTDFNIVVKNNVYTHLWTYTIPTMNLHSKMVYKKNKEKKITQAIIPPKTLFHSMEDLSTEKYQKILSGLHVRCTTTIWPTKEWIQTTLARWHLKHSLHTLGLGSYLRAFLCEKKRAYQGSVIHFGMFSWKIRIWEHCLLFFLLHLNNGGINPPPLPPPLWLHTWL